MRKPSFPIGISLPLRFLTGSILGVVVLSLTLASSAAALELSCERIPGILNQFLHKHIQFRHMNDELRERAIDSYVRRLDPSKTLYTASEADELRASLRGIFFDVGSGECGRLNEIQADIVVRFERMKAYVESVVNQDSYAVIDTVELVADPEKRARPRTREQQHALYSKLIHFQMVNYMSSGFSLEEAKGKLNHRYELMVKRARDFTNQDTYSLFLDSFANAMDPHSNYMSPEIEEDFKIQMHLSLIGIGVALASRDGYSVVEKIIRGGAADRVNELRPKDKVIAVAQDGEEPVDVVDMELRKVVRLIRGKRKTTVHLTILRQSPPTEPFVVSIVRDKINLEEQAAKLRFEEFELNGKTEKLAIIDLPSFYGGHSPSERKCSTDMRRLIKEANEANAAGLLLDLSRNGGGLLDTARDIAGFFIREGGVVAVKDEYGNIQVLRDQNAEISWTKPLVLLTSRISASASEIVAGAMKDYRRAVVVGDDHTFGKGTVQTLVPLPTGLGSLKVTTALFFRPGGQSTQHAGVETDIVLPSYFNSDEYGEKQQIYSLETAVIAPFLDGRANLDKSSPDGSQHYTPITEDVIAMLARQSGERVQANEKFAEVERKLEETRKNGGIIRLSEIIQENKEKEAKEAKEAEAKSSKGEEASAAEDAGSKKSGEAAEADAAKAEIDTVSRSDENDTTDEDERNEPSIQQLEAIQILADLVRISTIDGSALASDTSTAL